MNRMTIDKERVLVAEDSERLQLMEEVAAMTPDEFSTLIAVMKYGWNRVKAGESPEAVIADWRKETEA